MKRGEAAFYKKLTDPAALLRWILTLGLPSRLLRSGTRRTLGAQALSKLTGELGKLFGCVMSCDRPNVHGGRSDAATEELLQALGLPRSRFFFLPTRSGIDLHRVVEHMFGRLQQAFESWYAHDPRPHPVATYKAKVKELFFECPTIAQPEVIEADVRKLPWVLMTVAAAGGGEVPKCAR